MMRQYHVAHSYRMNWTYFRPPGCEWYIVRPDDDNDAFMMRLYLPEPFQMIHDTI